MASIDSLNLDREELKKLLTVSSRSRVQLCLQRELTSLEGHIKKLQERLEEDAKYAAELEQFKRSNADVGRLGYDAAHCTKITNYSWDQTSKFVKLYISLEGIQDLAESNNIKYTFTERTVDLYIRDLKGKSYSLYLKKLGGDVKSESSSVKVKRDMVVVNLAKASTENWSKLQGDKEKEKAMPAYDKDDDPSNSIMKMMKNMYDDGDDDMKRTIAKAWTEAQDKKSANPAMDEL